MGQKLTSKVEYRDLSSNEQAWVNKVMKQSRDLVGVINNSKAFEKTNKIDTSLLTAQGRKRQERRPLNHSKDSSLQEQATSPF